MPEIATGLTSPGRPTKPRRRRYAWRRANTRGRTTTRASASNPTRPTGAWNSTRPTRTWSPAGPTAYSAWAARPITIGLDFEAIRLDFVFHDLDRVAQGSDCTPT